MLAYLRYFLSLWLLYGFSLFCGAVAFTTLRDPSWLTGQVSYYIVPLVMSMAIACFFGMIGSLLFEALRWSVGRFVSRKKSVSVFFGLSVIINPFFAVEILPDPIMYLPLVLTSLWFAWLYRRSFAL